MQEIQQDDQLFDFNVFHYIGLIRKHLFLILGLFILGVGLAFSAYLVKPPLYKSSVLVKMDHMASDVIGFTDQFRWNPFRLEYFKTEFRIIKSVPVAEEVVKSLGLDFFRSPKGKDQPSSLLSLLSLGDSEPVQETEEQELNRIARGLLAGVTINEVRDTNLVQVSYTHTDPEKAMLLANTWIDSYIAHSLKMAYDKNLQAHEYLENKLTTYRQELAALYNKLGSEEEDSQSSAVMGQAKSVAEEQALVKLNEELAVANRGLTEKRVALQALRATIPSQSSEVNEMSIVKDLMSQLASKRTEYETNLNTYKPGLPKMVALKKEIASIEERLSIEQERAFNQLVRSITKDLEARRKEVANLQAQLSKQNERIIRAKLEEKELTSSVDTQISVLEQNIGVIEKRKEYIELSLGLKEIGRSDKVIVEPAKVPFASFAPSLKRYLLAGGVLSLGLAGLLIFLLEVTDRKIHNTEVLEMVTGLPTLATIPKVPDFAKNMKLSKDPTKRKAQALKLRQDIGLLTHLKPNDPFSESYRHLRTNIQLSKTTDNKVFLLSSALSGEGKTVSSLNLAVSFAQLEKKVLVIDCDLRRPKLHKIFNLPNQVGLVTSLVKKVPIKELISPTKIPNLFLLSSGPLPPNPAELIASQRMQDLIGELKMLFDYVIIDTAPLLAVTDASILGTLVDSLVFVSKASSTSRDEVARALQMLNQNNIKPLGTLFNDYDFTKGKRYYGYKYGYRYKYGYGYGYVPYTYNAPDES